MPIVQCMKGSLEEPETAAWGIEIIKCKGVDVWHSSLSSLSHAMRPIILRMVAEKACSSNESGYC